MTKRIRTPTLFALLIATVLASAYVIVAINGPAMGRPAGQPPAGVFH